MEKFIVQPEFDYVANRACITQLEAEDFEFDGSSVDEFSGKIAAYVHNQNQWEKTALRQVVLMDNDI